MIQVYVSNTSKRLEYAINLVLKQVCLFDYAIVLDKNKIEDHLPIINYSGERIPNSFQIHPHGLLSEKNIQQFEIDFAYGGEERVRIFLTEFDDLGFDVFSASFFLATRYEEYWKHETDQHGRYPSNISLASRIGFLHLPIINIWGEKLKNVLSNQFGLSVSSRKYKQINTIDIDNAWAYKNKGFVRSGGAVLKAGSKAKIKELANRISVLKGKKEDPYDTYDYLKKIQKEKEVESIYFFLLGDRGQFDKNISPDNPVFRSLIKNVSDYAEIGIHPSYGSYLNEKQLLKEIGRLENILKRPVKLSRKHFLKLSIPESYRNLEKAGVTDDYTMGYADNFGFRASMCTPFTFFDVLQDRELSITIHSFAYMDGTLNEYLNLQPLEAQDRIQFLKNEVKAVNGEFIGIWHNETVNDKGIWKGWRSVYESSFD